MFHEYFIFLWCTLPFSKSTLESCPGGVLNTPLFQSPDGFLARFSCGVPSQPPSHEGSFLPFRSSPTRISQTGLKVPQVNLRATPLDGIRCIWTALRQLYPKIWSNNSEGAGHRREELEEWTHEDEGWEGVRIFRCTDGLRENAPEHRNNLGWERAHRSEADFHADRIGHWRREQAGQVYEVRTNVVLVSKPAS